MDALIRTRYLTTLVSVVALALPTVASASVVSDAVERSSARTSATCPLTGKKAKRSVTNRPAVAVKIDNSEEGRPQSGLNKADVVIESPVEGGMTRLTAVFHCGSADSVGPVRSARYDDAEVVEQFTSFLAMSGANAPVEEQLNLWGLVTVDEASAADAMARDEELDEPYNLFAHTEALRSMAWENDVERPDDMIFGSIPPGSSKTTVVELDFSDATNVGYRWTRKGWARSQDGEASMSGGDRVYVQNVLVQEVDVTLSETLVDVDGIASPLMSLEGDGKAYLFRNGRVLPGKWSDDGEGAPAFRTKKGKRFTFTTGNTWYEFVPSGDGDVTGKVAYH
jgi:Protein of unknown function (DUF3048) N-terminal domain/Protein of unknown function (DUF3048) C-terminal domain